MIKRKKLRMAGIGTMLMAGVALFAWRKSEKRRAKLSRWRKQKIEEVYYNSLDEKDIPRG